VIGGGRSQQVLPTRSSACYAPSNFTAWATHYRTHRHGPDCAEGHCKKSAFATYGMGKQPSGSPQALNGKSLSAKSAPTLASPEVRFREPLSCPRATKDESRARGITVLVGRGASSSRPRAELRSIPGRAASPEPQLDLVPPRLFRTKHNGRRLQARGHDARIHRVCNVLA